MSDTAPQPSPFAPPAGGTASSPFAAPAQAGPAPSAPPTAEGIDTSFFDNVLTSEPLIKPCTVPGVLVQLEEKTSATSGNPFLNTAVQLFGDKMVFEDGTPVSPGKRLLGTVFLSAKDPEKFHRTARNVKNLLLALRDIPLDAHAEAAYKALPAAQKLGVVRSPTGAMTATIACLQPLSQWVNAKVLVQVTKGKDMDGNPRNEFNLLAASTKAVERKGRVS